MSYTELQSGKINVVRRNITMEEVDNYMKDLVEEEFPEKYKEILENNGFPCWCDGWIEVFNDEKSDEMYIYRNDTLFRVYDIKNHDCDGYFCEVNKTGDGEYKFLTQYYNGGTCLPEILEEEVEKL